LQIPTTKREWLYAVLALIGGVLGGLAGGRLSATAAATVAQVPQRTMAAQEILLVDAKDNRRGALSLNKDGDPALSFYDHHGKLRIALQISDDEGLGFKLFDTSGTLRVSLIINPDQIPALRLFDSQRHPRALLGVDPERDRLGPLVEQAAYERWHQMLFARFLAENGLLMHPSGVAVTLQECAELAQSEGEPDAWALAARYAGAQSLARTGKEADAAKLFAGLAQAGGGYGVLAAFEQAPPAGFPAPDPNVTLSARNIPQVRTIVAHTLNIVDAIDADYLIFTQDGLRTLEGVLTGGSV